MLCRRITSPGSASSNFKSFTSLNYLIFSFFNKLFLTELLVNDDESKVRTLKSVKLISVCSKRKSTFTISNAEIKGQRRKIEESVGKEEIVVLRTCKNTVISVRDDTPCTEKERKPTN